MLSRQHIISGLIDMRCTQTSYNLLNLPSLVTLVGGRKIENTYAADGRKLATVAKEGNELKEGTKTYNGNLVFDLNGDLEYILFPEGRILHDAGSFTYEYHLKDHLGSTRVAFTPSLGGGQGEAVQVNAFYPFGAPIAALSWSNQTQNKNRYLREGKEYVSDHDWNKYDYHTRIYNSWKGQFEQLDPLSALFPHISGYAAFLNNPMRVTDPTGMMAIRTDYRNEEGELLYRTDDGLTDIIIIPDSKLNEFENKLNELHDNDQLNDAEANKQELHTMGTEIMQYKDKYNTSNQNQDAGFSVGYYKAYNKESTALTNILYFFLAFGTEGAEMKIGYSRGKSQGTKDSEQGKINVLEPFKSLKNNPPLLTIPTIPKPPQTPKLPKHISIPK